MSIFYVGHGEGGPVNEDGPGSGGGEKLPASWDRS